MRKHLHTPGSPYMYFPHKHAHVTDQDHFYVVTCISNPVRYKSRYELYHRFKKGMERAGVTLMTVELALGNRSFEVTKPGDPFNVQVRSFDELWHKENLINIGISRLPSDWQYVAWIDADVEFLRPDWAEETVHLLQHYQLCQMWQNAIDTGPHGEVLATHESFGSCYINQKGAPVYDSTTSVVFDPYGYGYPYWHSGYAWAARREAIDHLGGLFEVSALGAADHHMAWSLLGRVLDRTPKFISEGYRRALVEWQNRAVTHIKQDFGYMDGTLMHHWHGKKRDRKYQERWDIIKKWDFDPELDLKRDWQGVLAWTARGERMRNDVRGYLRARNEDSIDLD